MLFRSLAKTHDNGGMSVLFVGDNKCLYWSYLGRGAVVPCRMDRGLRETGRTTGSFSLQASRAEQSGLFPRPCLAVGPRPLLFHATFERLAPEASIDAGALSLRLLSASACPPASRAPRNANSEWLPSCPAPTHCYMQAAHTPVL